MSPRTLAELADLCEAELVGDGTLAIRGPAALAEAGPDEISFLANPRYRGELEHTRAAAVLVDRALEVGRGDLALLRCDDPNTAFTRVVRAFVPERPRPPAGVHASAVVDPSARLAPDVHVGAGVVIGPRARLGVGAVVHPACVIGEDVELGEGSVLHPGVVLYEGVRVGARCTIHAGSVIGSEGFGFEPTPAGWVKIPQCGTVVIGDDVDIGANVTIDRARFGATRIGRGVKIDNLVHLAHNVVVGDGALLVAQVGVAGSATIGRGAILAGQVGINGHVRIGDGARIGAQSGILKDVSRGAEYFGSPAQPRHETWRQIAALQRLPGLLERVRELERRLKDAEAARSGEEGA
jgi:UDP-3-O-[3-hydroxymyristoyl] glucosamine N-acyltransferase